MVPQQYVVFNTSLTQTVYFGGDDVTSANGLPLSPESYMTIPLQASHRVYATASGSPEIRVAGTTQQAVVS